MERPRRPGFWSFIIELINLGASRDGEPKVIERGELIRHVSAALDWEEPKTEMALELFISGPREEFLKPVLPHRREDVYPWRFNRSMSYLRKPLILRAAAAGDVVVFGIRNVYLAGAYLTDLCIGGRLKARTDTMKRYISDTQATAAEKFNDEVAASLTSGMD